MNLKLGGQMVGGGLGSYYYKLEMSALLLYSVKKQALL